MQMKMENNPLDLEHIQDDDEFGQQLARILLYVERRFGGSMIGNMDIRNNFTGHTDVYHLSIHNADACPNDIITAIPKGSVH